jgi:hypothetical protein
MCVVNQKYFVVAKFIDRRERREDIENFLLDQHPVDWLANLKVKRYFSTRYEKLTPSLISDFTNSIHPRILGKKQNEDVIILFFAKISDEQYEAYKDLIT